MRDVKGTMWDLGISSTLDPYPLNLREGLNGAPEGLSGLRHCISVQEVSLQYLVQIQAASHGAQLDSAQLVRHCK